VRVGGQDQRGAPTQGAQRRDDEAQLRAAEARSDKIIFTDANAVQPRRVVQSEEPVGHAALLRKRCENGSGVPTYPLNPTWPEQFRE